ncbi:MAG TPA: XRE family transcriptional regulator [Spirochaetia bacterium]|nr:XRE family transcriptional regulator [Spirochaetia bacterium]
MEISELNRRIGEKLRALRTGRGLTLDQLAGLTGVSKPMLSQVERGETNPSVGTLWKIAVGLRLPFSTLMEDPLPEVTVVRAGSSTVFAEDDGRFLVTSLFAADAKHPVEVFQVLLRPGGRRVAEGHGAGVSEYLTVVQGSFILVLADGEHLLNEGDSIRFQATGQHRYMNPSNADCLLYMVIGYFATV